MLNRDDMLDELLCEFRAHRNYCGSDEYGDRGYTRLDFLAEAIFGFDTYDEEMDRVFARRAVETCYVITTGTTFEYIKNESDHMWFLIMCHMPFFKDRLSWGSSIRGAFWDFGHLKYTHVPLLDEGTEPAHLNKNEWVEFMYALFRFVKEDSDADV